MRKELCDERVFFVTFDGQRRQRERHGKSRVIPERSRRDGAQIGGVDFVDPDRVVNESAEFRIAGSRFKLHEQAVPRWASAAGKRIESSGGCHMGVRLTSTGRERLVMFSV